MWEKVRLWGLVVLNLMAGGFNLCAWLITDSWLTYLNLVCTLIHGVAIVWLFQMDYRSRLHKVYQTFPARAWFEFYDRGMLSTWR